MRKTPSNLKPLIQDPLIQDPFDQDPFDQDHSRVSQDHKRGLRPWRISSRRRRGAATLDYVLTMGVALPLIGILYVAGPKMMNLVNQMTTVLVSWPFM